MASSLVGVTMRAFGEPGRLERPMRSIMGSENAAVLPVPVLAAATTSRPSRASGIACSCTGVGTEKPIRSTADRVASDRPRASNVAFKWFSKIHKGHAPQRVLAFGEMRLNASWLPSGRTAVRAELHMSRVNLHR